MYVERGIGRQFSKIAAAYNIVAVVGARQAGKTTFLKEHMKKLNANYVLFDDPDVRSLFEADVKKFGKQYLQGNDVTVLDEVQYCRDAGTKLKYLADTGRKLWITSSSEIILGREILSFLVGRVSILRLYPFSLDEFMDAKGQTEFTEKILERGIWEHLCYGGYPKIVLTEDVELKKTMLHDIYDTMILKDIARTFSIDDSRTLENFIKYLAISIGGQVSYEKISAQLGISFQTIKKYLNAMEKSYLIIPVLPFFTNKTKEITKQPKMYFLDTGLRNSITKTFGNEPDGKLFENYVLSELVKLGLPPKYWRTKSKVEVDFVVERENEIIPIEVKINAAGKVESGMRSFIESYRPKRAIIVSLKGAAEKTAINGCMIYFTNPWGLHEILGK